MIKLQIKYNCLDLEKALTIAEQTKDFADIMEIGALLIYQEGVNAIKKFKQAFPQKLLCADAKIAGKGEESVNLFAKAGATHISVLAGAYHSIIKDTCDAAQEKGVHIVLDFINTYSLGQSASEAEILGAHAILLHRSMTYEEGSSLQSQWEEVCDNTNLPVFLKGKINIETIQDILPLKPAGIVVGSTITAASNPEKEAERIRVLLDSKTEKRG